MLDELDERQRLAVSHGDSPLLILAGPGAGKTRVLCHRIKHLAGTGTPPARILAVTFTRKAAREMKSRLNRMMASPPQWVLTFHGLCVRILRESGAVARLEKGWTIADTAQSRKITRKAIESLKLKIDEWKPADEHTLISRRKNLGIDPADPPVPADGYIGPRLMKSYAIHRRYNRLMADQNRLDFDDLLIYTVRVLNMKETGQGWERRWDHVLVDEFQDTNQPQYRITELLSGHRRITTVGDPDQSIYGWRGAEKKNINRFRRDFEPRIVELNRNYRSEPNIVRAARGVMESAGAEDENDGAVERRDLRSTGTSSQRVTVVMHPTDRAEANWVHNLAADAVESGKPPADCRIGVLYRVNSLSRLFEERLIRSAIPYTISGGARFYDRAEIQDAIAYLHIIHNPEDDEALERVINRPPRGLGLAGLRKIRDIDVDKPGADPDYGLPLSETEYPDDYGTEVDIDRYSLLERTRLAAGTPDVLNGRQANAAKHLVEVIDLMRTKVATGKVPPEAIVEGVLEKSGYLEHLAEGKKEGDADRIDNLHQLMATAHEFAARCADDGRKPTLEGFLDEVTLMTDREPDDESRSLVHLMTLHASKGLEFPTVALVAVEDGLCPLKSRKEEYRLTEDQVREERRLFYVGMTRAEKRLYISQADIRNRFGKAATTKPSQYISDLPPNAVECLVENARVRPVRQPKGKAPRPESRRAERGDRQRNRQRPGYREHEIGSEMPPPPPPGDDYSTTIWDQMDDRVDAGGDEAWADGELLPAGDAAPLTETGRDNQTDERDRTDQDERGNRRHGTGTGNRQERSEGPRQPSMFTGRLDYSRVNSPKNDTS